MNFASLTAEDFRGRWRLIRRIEDRRAGQGAAMAGEARFTGQAPDLAYHEAGDLRLGTGPVLRAERRYLWRFHDDRVTVRFEDGRAFHAFPLTVEADGSDHPCGEDLYRVTYDFRDWPHWRATWVVVGPRKDYSSVSDYTPLR